MDKNFSVYLITNTITGKVYIGQTTKSLHRRWQLHQYQAKRDSPYYFHKSIRKHGVSAFDIQEVARVNNQTSANNLEKLWIILCRSSEQNFGYNSTLGGESGVLTSESIEKRTQKLIGRKLSDETKLKIKFSIEKAWKDGKYLHIVRTIPAHIDNCGTKHPKYRHDICFEDVKVLYDKYKSFRLVGKILNCNPRTIKSRLEAI